MVRDAKESLLEGMMHDDVAAFPTSGDNNEPGSLKRANSFGSGDDRKTRAH
jgi:hypothetical protein